MVLATDRNWLYHVPRESLRAEKICGRKGFSFCRDKSCQFVVVLWLHKNDTDSDLSQILVEG